MLFSEASTHNHARTTLSRIPMSSDATLGVETRASKRKRECRDASAANAGEAIPGLLNDIVITHVLRSENFNDPADVARLRAVSHAMNDAVTATGCQLNELSAHDAVRRGCLSAVERLQRRGMLHAQEREYLCHAAVRSGHLEKLKLLRENNAPWNGQTCAGAALGGHLEVLQWLRANSCPWDEETCAQAALGGHLEVLQWAHANGCPWDASTCYGAAWGGHLEVLQWAHANDCPWDEYTCTYAAKGGHLEVLQWARVNGCPWNKWTCINATKGGHDAIVQWAKANGAPYGAPAEVSDSDD